MMNPRPQRNYRSSVMMKVDETQSIILNLQIFIKHFMSTSQKSYKCSICLHNLFNILNLLGNREAALSQKILMRAYQSLSLVALTIVIPTSRSFTSKLGGDDLFAGLLVGLMPLSAGIMSIPNIWIIQRVEFRTMVLMGLMSLLVGNVVYGLANLAGSKWFLLISRSIMGLFGAGPLIAWSFVARSFGVEKRSKFSSIMGAFTSLGFSLGPFLGWALEKITQGLEIDGVVFNVYTIPAWFVSCICFFMIIFVFIFLKEPPKIDRTTTIPMTLRQRLSTWTASYVLAIGTTLTCSFINGGVFSSFETYVMALTQKTWGWTVDNSALYLAGIMFVLFPATLWSATLRKYQDRKVVLTFQVVGSINFLWMYHYSNDKVVDIVLFTIGACIALSANMIATSFTWALQTKLTPPDQRAALLGMNASVYMLGRGSGAFIGSAGLSQSTFAALGMGALKKNLKNISGT